MNAKALITASLMMFSGPVLAEITTATSTGFTRIQACEAAQRVAKMEADNEAKMNSGGNAGSTKAAFSGAQCDCQQTGPNSWQCMATVRWQPQTTHW